MTLVRTIILSVAVLLSVPHAICAQGENAEEIARREAELEIARLAEEARIEEKLWNTPSPTAPKVRATDSPLVLSVDGAEGREMLFRGRRLAGFLKEVEQLRADVRALRALRYAPMSEPWAIRDLARRAKDLENMADRLLDFVEDGSDPEIEVFLPEENLAACLRRLSRVTRRLIPRVVALSTGAILDVSLYRYVVASLAQIRSIGALLHASTVWIA
jgi:hypothetical protein